MGAIGEKLHSARRRLSERKADRSAAKTARAQRKAEGMARRNEYHRGGDHTTPRA
jgi:hypothetical protein